ncbi:hypothetical protein NSA19_09150 [Actinomyces bowdenii]|uniref:hypothetical protein n=1 Tax=Actinomyces bowdenii TaxID=131109 RepID=UPI00214A9E2F|nr:hypothetical protein [Actinomyces bowdenii]MCR2053003.1 hypothetical protein [Actinomyces bowdenii]
MTITPLRPAAARRSRVAALLAMACSGALALGACGSSSPQAGDGASQAATRAATRAASSAPAHDHDDHSGEGHGSDRFVLAYDGGVKVLDASSLEEVADFPLEGFLRLNAFGDNEHVLVTTEAGFRVLSTGAGGGEPALTDLVFPATKAGHVTPHGDWTVLFDDGTGRITVVKTDSLGHSASDTVASLPASEEIASDKAHHGVAIKLSDGTVLRTLGDEETRVGALAQDASGKETARSEECPGVHGEGALKGEAVVLGCQDGVLLYKNGAFTKIASPDAGGGRVGNAYVTDSSPVAVTDYKENPDSEKLSLSRLGILDSQSASFEVIDLPQGVEYTWRGVRRDGQGNAWVLGTDGALHKVDVAGRSVTDSIPVIGAWSAPEKWQEAHPALQIEGEMAWVTEPATKTVHKVDLTSGEVTKAEVGVAPSEVAFAKHTHQH